MLELADKNIEIVIITIFIFKMLNGDMKDIKNRPK